MSSATDDVAVQAAALLHPLTLLQSEHATMPSDLRLNLWELVRTELEIESGIRSLREDELPAAKIESRARFILSAMERLQQRKKAIIEICERNPSASYSEQLRADLGSLEKKHSKIQYEYREARSMSKRKHVHEEVDRRKALFDTAQETLRHRKQIQSESAQMEAADDIIDSLRRSQKALANDVERSQETLKVLHDSSSTLMMNLGENKEIESNTKGSKSRMKHLQRRDVLDRIMIFLAALFFFLVVLYIINRRIGVFAVCSWFLTSLSHLSPF
eukprot:TRINITY_DN17429_c0_g1_i1.p1 TRINITY_DN17429_c0_g1~~TRINITY_DN17429_c0_g1_i1.p1  ORF type:complete len:274 (-),score=53.06 TRINITY_DN17429_c0_g1_i1:72-893(-)